MIAAEFGDARSEVAAIGDDANGIPMLARAHTGVVMGQATEHVKAVAQHTTGTNEDDGLATWVNTMLTLGDAGPRTA